MQIYYNIIRVHPVSGSANYPSNLSQSILKHAAFWDILSLTITDSFLQAKRTLYDPEMTSQFHRGLVGVRTWSHTRWCYIFHFTYAFVHDDSDNPYSSTDIGNPREKSHLHLSNFTGNAPRPWTAKKKKKKTKCLFQALPFSNPLRSSNDARPKMSDQLTVLPLTFNWQTGKQTHAAERVVLWTPND